MTPKPNPAVRYTAMRLGVFVASFVILAVLVRIGVLPAGLGDSNYLWVMLLAIVVSAPLSFVLLRGQRAQMSEQIVGRVQKSKERLAANRSSEDEADDEARGSAS
ncbi:DUF4229 domain-containing protein [Streptomyces synnematoformans]|uniref:DUF4229 domain-containing protein n=1 Tax=Streptomyces synnematoformans TaxID=415721 RepID=A0ABP5L1L6_9ACTN